jgi:hypothetical protein
MREAQAVAGAAKRGFRMSLRWKLSLLITSLVGLAVVLVGLFLLRQQQQSLTAEMTKRGLTIAKSLAASAKAPLITNDELTLLVMVKDAMRDPDVAYVIVADVDGKVLAQSDASADRRADQPPRRPPGPEGRCARPDVPDGGGGASSTSRCPSSTATCRWAASISASASAPSTSR